LGPGLPSEMTSRPRSRFDRDLPDARLIESCFFALLSLDGHAKAGEIAGAVTGLGLRNLRLECGQELNPGQQIGLRIELPAAPFALEALALRARVLWSLKVPDLDWHGAGCAILPGDPAQAGVVMRLLEWLRKA
jgi:hypothetical protein